MTIKKQMRDTAKMVDFFNTLTDKDVEMIEFIDTAINEDKRPNLAVFEETFCLLVQLLDTMSVLLYISFLKPTNPS